MHDIDSIPTDVLNFSAPSRLPDDPSGEKSTNSLADLSLGQAEIMEELKEERGEMVAVEDDLEDYIASSKFR